MFLHLFKYLLPFIILKLYWKLNTRWNGSYKCLIGKTAVVTGANTGIGYYTALDLAKRGAKVILACRNKEKAEEARRNIVDETGNSNVFVKIVDFESFDSVKNFARDFNQTEDRLDILINNAGISGLDYETKDGLPVVLQVNHFSPFLLTNLLFDKLKQSSPSRIINVASNMVQFGKFQPKNVGRRPNLNKPWIDWQIYSNSKLCNAVFTIELSKRTNGTGVVTHAVHPGVIFTNIFDSISVIGYVAMYSLRWLLKTPEEGAQTTLYAALSEYAGNVNGRFFNNCKDVGHYKNAIDSPDFCREVWAKSEDIVGLKVESE